MKSPDHRGTVQHLTDFYIVGKGEQVPLCHMVDAHNNPEHPFNVPIEAPCTVCGVMDRVPGFTAAFGWAHDECRTKRMEEDQLNEAKRNWFSICPTAYASRDRKDTRFPRTVFEALRSHNLLEQPVIITGAPNTGKTWLALEYLKVYMLQGKSISILWPDDIEGAGSGWEQNKLSIQWAMADVVYFDEPLGACPASNKIAPAIAKAMNILRRRGKTWIASSRYGLDGAMVGGDFSDNLDKATYKRLLEPMMAAKTVTTGIVRKTGPINPEQW